MESRTRMQNALIVQHAAGGMDRELDGLLALPDEVLENIADKIITDQTAQMWLASSRSTTIKNYRS